MEELKTALKGYLTEIACCQIAIDDAHGLAKLLGTLDEEKVDGVAVMVPESPQVRDAMVRLLERNIKVVQFLSGQEKPPEVDFGGIAVIVHERTPFTEQALRDDLIDAVITQDPGHAVRSAIRIMRARSDARQPLAAQEKIRIEIFIKENP